MMFSSDSEKSDSSGSSGCDWLLTGLTEPGKGKGIDFGVLYYVLLVTNLEKDRERELILEDCMAWKRHP